MPIAPLVCALLLLPGDTDWFWNRLDEVEARLKKEDAEQTKGALPILDRMEKAAAEAGDEDWLLYARWRKGTCQFRLGRSADAAKTLRSAIDHAPAKHGLLFLVYRDLGEVYNGSNRYNEGAEYLKNALECAPPSFKGKDIPIPDLERLRIRLLREACVANGRGPDAAWDGINKVAADIAAAREKARAAGKGWPPGGKYLRVECEMLIAEQERRRGDSASALSRLRRCQKDLEGDDSPAAQRYRFKCHISLGMSYMKLTRFADARDETRLAARFLDDPRFRTDGTVADVDALSAGWQIDQADIAYEKARRAAGADRRRKLAKDLLAGLDAVEQSVSKSLDDARKGDDGAGVASGNALFHRAQVQELRAGAYKLAGATADADKELERAAKSYDDALTILKSKLTADNDYLLEFRRRRARLILRRGDADTAASEAADAQKLLAGAYGKGHWNYGLFEELLLEADARRRDYDGAARHAEKQREWAAERLTRYLPGLTAAEQLTYFLETDDPGLHASLRLGYDGKSLQEPSLEWLLNGKAKIADALASVHRQPDRDAKNALDLQRAIRRQAYLVYGGAATNAQADLLQAELETRLAVTERKGDGAGPSYTAKRLREALHDDEVYVDVVYLPGDKGDGGTYFAWVVTTTDPVRVLKLGDADTVNRLVKTFQDHMRDFNDIAEKDGLLGAETKLRKDCLDELSRIVLHRVMDAAHGKARWIVSPDGQLWNVPWAAMLLPGGDKYAVEDITFRYVVSGRDVIDRAAGGGATGAPFVLADPDLDDHAADSSRRDARDPLSTFGPLKASRKEAREAAACLQRFFNQEPQMAPRTAGKDALLGLATPPRVVYLATHGFYNAPLKLEPDDPFLRCGIAFAGLHYLPRDPGKDRRSLPGLMTGAEVMSAPLRGTELVVLSACDSGLGELQYGQSPADLRQAFHFAGARAVVSAVWSVDDGSTCDLMIDFMHNLYSKPQPDKADALRRAQREEIHDTQWGRRTHPFYWAAFTLSGF